MCNCGNNRRTPKQAQVPSLIPTVVENTNQQLVQQSQNQEAIHHQIQKAMIKKQPNRIAR